MSGKQISAFVMERFQAKKLEQRKEAEQLDLEWEKEQESKKTEALAKEVFLE